MSSSILEDPIRVAISRPEQFLDTSQLSLPEMLVWYGPSGLAWMLAVYKKPSTWQNPTRRNLKVSVRSGERGGQGMLGDSYQAAQFARFATK